MTKETLKGIRNYTQWLFIGAIIFGFFILYMQGIKTEAPINIPKAIAPPKDTPSGGWILVLLGLAYYAARKTIDLIFLIIEKKLIHERK